MSELSDYKRLVEAPAIRSYEATITSLKAELEKLKAEADPEALVIAHMHGAQMATEKHREEIEKLKAERDEAQAEITHWFNLAGFNMRGGGFHSYKEEVARLTSQLEQAERVIAPFADENEAQVEERVPFTLNDELPHTFYRATYANLIAASQWIKDRQAKGEG